MNPLGAILLLHGSGWDELLMVAVGLVLAFVVITLTGRKRSEVDDADDVPVDEPSERGR